MGSVVLLSSVYIGAIALADLTVAHFGPKAMPFTAFFLVGADFGIRNNLHDELEKIGRKNAVYLLVLAGSVTAAALNPKSSRVALASFTAFLCDGIVGTSVYGRLKGRHKNAGAISVIVSSLTDSSIFQFLAFGSIDIRIALAQWILKSCGGIVWSSAFRRAAG